jgi:hypothetical protein
MPGPFRNWRKSVRGGPAQAFATHLIAPGFKTPTIAKAHVLMRRTTSIQRAVGENIDGKTGKAATKRITISADSS